MNLPLPPDAESFELDEATVAVRDLIGASRELVGRLAHALDMHATDMAAIGVLIQHGPIGAADLARRLGIHSASATALVDRLERAGHAERVRDTVDRRRVLVSATPAAGETVDATWRPGIHDIDRLCRDLTAEQRALVVSFLRQVTAAIDRTS